MTHPELKATFCLPILGVKKNPSSPLYTTLGVITKGTVVEVNVSELGLVTQGGKVIWGECNCLRLRLTHSVLLLVCACLLMIADGYYRSSSFKYDGPCALFKLRWSSCGVALSYQSFCVSGKYAQVTNNPENDGCINAVLLV